MYQVKIENTVSENKRIINVVDGINVESEVKRSPEEKANLEAFVISEKEAEIQAKVDAYEAAIADQLANGGPGPVADFDIMKIVNEESGSFEVVFK